jgi:8-oxo-dGTP diphosphatase
MPETRRTVARAMITLGGQVLLAQGRGESCYHLPGGEVEAGEEPVDACVREVREELGREVAAIAPVATFAHRYDRDGTTVHETNHVFAVQLVPVRQEDPPRSAEAHLTLAWKRIAELEARMVRPPAMLPLMWEVGGA